MTDEVSPESKAQSGRKRSSLAVRWAIATVIALPTLCVGSCGAWIWWLGAVTKDSIEQYPEYQVAIERARTQPEIVDELGEPIRANFWSGSADESSPEQISIRVLIAGPKGVATMFVEAGTEAEAMYVEIGAKKIDLKPAESE